MGERRGRGEEEWRMCMRVCYIKGVNGVMHVWLSVCVVWGVYVRGMGRCMHTHISMHTYVHIYNIHTRIHLYCIAVLILVCSMHACVSSSHIFLFSISFFLSFFLLLLLLFHSFYSLIHSFIYSLSPFLSTHHYTVFHVISYHKEIGVSQAGLAL